MKKDTKAVAGAPGRNKGKQVAKRGRKKEKVQISVRIGEEVMGQAYDFIKESGQRITDLIERGIVLAMREQRYMPVITSQARYVVEHVGIATQRRFMRLAALERLPEVRPLSALEECVRLFYLTGIDSVEEWPDYEQSLALVGQPPSLGA